VLWKVFTLCQDFAPLDALLDSIDNKFRPLEWNARTLRNESEIIVLARGYLSDVFSDRIYSVSMFDKRESDFATQHALFQSFGDIVYLLSNKTTAIIEFKYPAVLVDKTTNELVEDLRTYFNEHSSHSTDPIVSSLRQLFKYLHSSNVSFGMLSCLSRSWIVMLTYSTNNYKLYVSDPIHQKDFFKSCWNLFESSAKRPKVQENIDDIDSSHYRVPSLYQDDTSSSVDYEGLNNTKYRDYVQPIEKKK